MTVRKTAIEIDIGNQVTSMSPIILTLSVPLPPNERRSVGMVCRIAQVLLSIRVGTHH